MFFFLRRNQQVSFPLRGKVGMGVVPVNSVFTVAGYVCFRDKDNYA